MVTLQAQQKLPQGHSLAIAPSVFKDQMRKAYLIHPIVGSAGLTFSRQSK